MEPIPSFSSPQKLDAIIEDGIQQMASYTADDSMDMAQSEQNPWRTYKHVILIDFGYRHYNRTLGSRPERQKRSPKHSKISVASQDSDQWVASTINRSTIFALKKCQ